MESVDSSRSRQRLGLPGPVRACLFDLDGVLTRTAEVHRRAWEQALDPVLAAHGSRPFSEADYLEHVDGKPRLAGVRDLLAARGIALSAEKGQDPVRAVGERKNALLLELLDEQGVEVFERSVDYLRAVRDAGLRTGGVTSSANGARVVRAAGVADLLDVLVDGVVARERGLRGKPAPDTFLAAADALGVGPAEAAVFEDSLAGVAAGRAGGFALVVGVDQRDATDATSHEERAVALRANGADVVVRRLTDLMEVP